MSDTEDSDTEEFTEEEVSEETDEEPSEEEQAYLKLKEEANVEEELLYKESEQEEEKKKSEQCELFKSFLKSVIHAMWSMPADRQGFDLSYPKGRQAIEQKNKFCLVSMMMEDIKSDEVVCPGDDLDMKTNDMVRNWFRIMKQCPDLDALEEESKTGRMFFDEQTQKFEQRTVTEIDDILFNIFTAFKDDVLKHEHVRYIKKGNIKRLHSRPLLLVNRYDVVNKNPPATVFITDIPFTDISEGEVDKAVVKTNLRIGEESEGSVRMGTETEENTKPMPYLLRGVIVLLNGRFEFLDFLGFKHDAGMRKNGVDDVDAYVDDEMYVNVNPMDKSQIQIEYVRRWSKRTETDCEEVVEKDKSPISLEVSKIFYWVYSPEQIFTVTEEQVQQKQGWFEYLTKWFR